MKNCDKKCRIFYNRNFMIDFILFIIGDKIDSDCT